MAITSGSYTIGDGGDYATLYDLGVDITWGSLTGNISATYISDVVEDSSPDFFGDNGIYDIYVTMNGDYTVSANNTDGIRFRLTGSAGRCVIDGLHIVNTAASNGLIRMPAGNANVKEYIIKNCELDNGGFSIHVINIVDDEIILRCYNNLIYDWDGRANYAICCSNILSATIENNTCYSDEPTNPRGIYCSDKLCDVINNVVAIVNGFNGSFYNLTSATGYNNASTGDTGEDGDFLVGQGNISNINPYHEFLSLDPTSPYFLKPRPGQQIAKYGTRPTQSTTDIATSARPHIAP